MVPQQQQVQINPATGQPDYSQQWIDYYRSLGLMREAEAVEQQAKQQQQGNFKTLMNILRKISYWMDTLLLIPQLHTLRYALLISKHVFSNYFLNKSLNYRLFLVFFWIVNLYKYMWPTTHLVSVPLDIHTVMLIKNLSFDLPTCNSISTYLVSFFLFA